MRPLLPKLYAEHHDDLVRFLLSRVRCLQTAKELAQESFARVARHSQLEQVLDLRAYLFRVALNLLSDYQHQRARHAHSLQDLASLHADLVDKRTAERRIIAEEELKRIAVAVRGLTPLCQRIFYLNRIDGLKHREIATQLGISRRTVEDNLKRAMEQVTRAFEQQ